MSPHRLVTPPRIRHRGAHALYIRIQRMEYLADHDPAALAETDARQSVALAVRGHDHLVAVFEELARLTVRELHGLGAAPRQLEQAAARFLRRAGDRAAGEEVARTEVAAVRGVMGDELGDGPVHVAEVAAAEAHGLGHRLRAQPHFD